MTPLRYRHYIWDFDGTLFDSYPLMAWAMERALRDYGLVPPPGEVLGWLKRSVKETVAHYEKEAGPSGLKARFRCYEKSADPGLIKPYPGAKHLLGELCRQGGAHYLYTHRGESARDILQAHCLLHLFRDCITGEDGFPRKPAPNALIALLERNGISPGLALMTGDRDVDLGAAAAAGITGCLFDPQGFYPHFPAPMRASSMDELKRLLLPM